MVRFAVLLWWPPRCVSQPNAWSHYEEPADRPLGDTHEAAAALSFAPPCRDGIIAGVETQQAREPDRDQPCKQIYSRCSEACGRTGLDNPKIWTARPCMGRDLLRVWPPGMLDGNLLDAKESRKACAGHSTHRRPLPRCIMGELDDGRLSLFRDCSHSIDDA